MSEDNNDSTTCPVCFELYKETGGHIPRLLPCSHTLCHSCTVTLTRNGKLECPQDRQVHHAKKGRLIFPQNQYILKQLEMKPSKTEFQICIQHNKEKNLYCKELWCQTVICSVCLTEKHNRHAVVDFLTVKENVINDVAAETERLSKNLAEHKEKLTKLRDETNEKYSLNVDKINGSKTDFMDSIQPKIKKIEGILQKLENIRKRTNPKMKCEDLSTTKQWIEDLKKDSDLIVNGSTIITTFDLKEDKVTFNPTGTARFKISARKILDRGKSDS